MMLLLACVATDGPTDSADDTAPVAPIALTDESNYAYTLDIAIRGAPFIPTNEGLIDWSTLDRDLQGFTVDPTADITEITIVWLRDLTSADVEAAIVSGTLVQSSVGLVARGEPEAGATSLRFDAFDVYGTAFDPEQYFLEPGGTWLLRVATTTNASAMLLFLLPGEGAQDVYVGNDSAVLDFTADLATLAPITPGAATDVSWGSLTTDGRGAPIDPLLLQELWIARYDLPPADLAARFFELESLAAETWSLNVYGEDHAALTDALDADGAAFPGFGDSAGTWLLSLRCVLCATPAPSFLTVVGAE